MLSASLNKTFPSDPKECVTHKVKREPISIVLRHSRLLSDVCCPDVLVFYTTIVWGWGWGWVSLPVTKVSYSGTVPASCAFSLGSLSIG